MLPRKITGPSPSPLNLFQLVLLKVGLSLVSSSGATPGTAADRPTIHPEYFALQVVDQATGRGVPLVELKTVNEIVYVTDNAGWVAFREPGLMNEEVFWHVSGPGVELPKDGFGFSGFRARAEPGGQAKIQVSVTNIAIRLGRLTGQGLYHHSALLGLDHPPTNLRHPGVLGQDSVQAAPFNGKLFWLWGDTNVANRPLGNYHTTSGFTPLEAHPETGLIYDYLLEEEASSQRLRRMFPASEPGAIWIFGLCAVPNEQNQTTLLAGYTRQPGLVPPHERGIVRYDAKLGHFVKAADVDLADQWHMPAGCAEVVRSEEGAYVYFCTPYAYRRAPATAAAVADPSAYETFGFNSERQEWEWRLQNVPTSAEEEKQLLSRGKLKDPRYQLQDALTGRPVNMHTASIRWNPWRQRFILIGVEAGAPESYLGEVWYAESLDITGPWRSAVKVASHPDYSFYNPVHHTFFDREDGRLIYFEGTYTKQFSGNPLPTPRYDYNQLAYRLDLADPRLKPAHVEPPQ